jgi:orotate phosphoribosyltransferase
LSTSVELGDAVRPAIVVTSEDRRRDFLCEFARRCFSSGDFRTRSGRRNKWLLDCKKGFGDGAATRAIATELVRLASEKGLSQFAGSGFGAYVLVGGILAVKGISARGALIRSRAKKYGTERLIEGDLDPSRPVCIVDDILNSGASALDAACKLRDEGYAHLHHMCVFHFEWGQGTRRLNQEGINCDCLATVRQAKLECRPASNWATRMSIGAIWRSWHRLGRSDS